MKPLYLLLIALSLILPIHADTITELTNISNPQQVFDYDQYDGYILSYENRLFVQNYYKIEEFLIADNGELERLSIFETKDENPRPFIDGDKYYLLKHTKGEVYKIGLYVFDLSQTPMVLHTYIDLESLEITNGESLFFSQNHIFVPDRFRDRAWKISKETYEVDGYLEIESDGNGILIDNDVMMRVYSPGLNLQLELFTIIDEDYQTQPLSSVPLYSTGGVYDMVLYDDKLTISTTDEVIVVDLSDIEAPVVMCSITRTAGFSSAFFDGDYLYAYPQIGNGVLIFEIDEVGGYNMVTMLYFGATGMARNDNICKVGSYLYTNTKETLRVYDVANGFQQVAEYGIFCIYPLFSVAQDDVYYWKQWESMGEYTYEIYSVLDNHLICTLAYPFAYPDGFKIMGDRLYVSINLNTGGYFDIYGLTEAGANLLNHVYIGTWGWDFNIVGGKVYMHQYNPEFIKVYSLINDDIEYVGSFDGRMQYTEALEPQNVVYNFTSTTLYIRDVRDPFNILFQQPLNMLSGYSGLTPIDDYHFIIHSEQLQTYLYRYDVVQNTVSLLSSYEHNFDTVHNGVIAVNALNNDENTYYSLQEGVFTEIGQLNTTRMVWHTYFFPERHKMVQVAFSGIWTYDIEYTSDGSADTDVVVPASGAVLHGNYPNPFNPTTAISFTLGSAGAVSIDVYNVRGQLVRGLVSGVYGAGVHSVVWDGRGDDGAGVGSGVYFYRMSAGGGVSVKKMVMVK